MSSPPSFIFPRESRTYDNSQTNSQKAPNRAVRRTGNRGRKYKIIEGQKVRRATPHPYSKNFTPIKKLRFGMVDPNLLDLLDPMLKLQNPRPFKLRIPSPLNPTRQLLDPISSHRVALPNDELLQRVIRCNTEEDIKLLSQHISDFIIQGAEISPIHIEILTAFKQEKGDRLYNIALKTWTPELYWSKVNKLVDEKIALLSESVLRELTETFEAVQL